MSVGVPIKLVHESKNHIITIEVKTGELYRGYMVEIDDTMNCLIENCHHTSITGKNSYYDKVYIRGSQIRFIIVPDMFKNAPMFSRVKNLARLKNDAILRKKAQKIRDQVVEQMKPA